MANVTYASDGPSEEVTPWEWRKRLTDAVLGSLSLSDDIPERIQTNAIYSAFHELQPRYPHWLGSLYFETSHHATVCKGLEDILFSLGAFGLVTVENYDFKLLRISPKAKEVTKHKVKVRFSNDDRLKELEGLSNEFAKSIEKHSKVSPK